MTKSLGKKNIFCRYESLKTYGMNLAKVNGEFVSLVRAVYANNVFYQRITRNLKNEKVVLWNKTADVWLGDKSFA